MSGITKGERTELRGVVRQQFKVLRAEVEQRQTELLAQTEQEIVERYVEEDANWSALQHKVHELVLEANRGINDALVEHGFRDRGPTERNWLTEPRMTPPTKERTQLRLLASTKIGQQVHSALLMLQRQEADLLRNLAVGALESEEAHSFLAEIPTVAELVPAARLAELESAVEDSA